MLLNNKYKKIKLIGEGTFGEVYLYENIETKENVALKQLRPQIDLRDEINAMKKINNQFVITFYEGFKVELNYFIVMEYCQNGDLAQEIIWNKTSNLKLSNEIVFLWAYEIIEGMCFIHSQRIFHRDIKPANVFLAHDFHIKLGDLGVARVFDITSTSMSSDNEGSKPYMSPEIKTNQKYTYKTDIWSAGCVIYELITLEKYDESPSLLENESHNSKTKILKDLLIEKMLKEDPVQRITSKSLQKGNTEFKNNFTENEYCMAVSLYEKNRRQKSFPNFNVLSLKTKKENYFFINYKLKMILIIIAIIFGAYSFKYYKQHREKRICFEKDFSFDVYFKEGLRLLELRTYSKSLECFNKAIELNSDYALAFYHKGLVLAHLEKYEESIDNFDKAIDLQPNHVESLYNKALSFYELRNYDKGDECLNKVKELNQDFKIYFKPRRV